MEQSSPTPAAYQPPERRGWAVDVRRAIDRLGESQRRVLTLSYFERLTQSEIAARLGMPLGEVSSSAATGLTRLATLLSAAG